MKEITYIMLKEHAKIDSMIIDFENSLVNNKEQAKSNLNKLNWILDKHFFVEEKVIFHIYNKLKEKESQEIIELLKQHKDIQWLLKSIEDSLRTNKKPQIKELKQILKIHVDIENNIFYPELDDELDENNKQLILERVEDIVINDS